MFRRLAPCSRGGFYYDYHHHHIPVPHHGWRELFWLFSISASTNFSHAVWSDPKRISLDFLVQLMPITCHCHQQLQHHQHRHHYHRHLYQHHDLVVLSMLLNMPQFTFPQRDRIRLCCSSNVKESSFSYSINHAKHSKLMIKELWAERVIVRIQRNDSSSIDLLLFDPNLRVARYLVGYGSSNF